MEVSGGLRGRPGIPAGGLGILSGQGSQLLTGAGQGAQVDVLALLFALDDVENAAPDVHDLPAEAQGDDGQVIQVQDVADEGGIFGQGAVRVATGGRGRAGQEDVQAVEQGVDDGSKEKGQCQGDGPGRVAGHGQQGIVPQQEGGSDEGDHQQEDEEVAEGLPGQAVYVTQGFSGGRPRQALGQHQVGDAAAAHQVEQAAPARAGSQEEQAAGKGAGQGQPPVLDAKALLALQAAAVGLKGQDGGCGQKAGPAEDEGTKGQPLALLGKAIGQQAGGQGHTGAVQQVGQASGQVLV